MLKSETTGEITKALVNVQRVLRGVRADSTNPFYKAKYASLTAVWEACRIPLAENGLAVTQTMSVGEDHRLIIDTTLLHTSGEWIGGHLPMILPKDDPQGAGQAITYGRRYGLSAIVGICPEDDDAESTVQRQAPEKPAPRKKPIAEELKNLCDMMGWGKEDWQGYIQEHYGKEKLSQLTEEEKQDALTNLRTAANVAISTGEKVEVEKDS